MANIDRYAERVKEKNNLVQGIKADIKAMLTELGYGNGTYAKFSLTAKPDRFTRVGTLYSSLFFMDDNGNEWHEDNINDVNELLGILRAVHHILPR